MIKKVKIISFILIIFSIFIILYFELIQKYDVHVQNKVIDNIFSINVSDNNDSYEVIYNDLSIDDYLGYIYIPRFNIKKLIKYDTNSSILNDGYVGLHRLSGNLDNDDLIILAGHNVSNVFHKLHSICIGDYVYINTYISQRKFAVYDLKIVNEYDVSDLTNNRKNELLLITCTEHSGERLLVFLKEEK